MEGLLSIEEGIVNIVLKQKMKLILPLILPMILPLIGSDRLTHDNDVDQCRSQYRWRSRKKPIYMYPSNPSPCPSLNINSIKHIPYSALLPLAGPMSFLPARCRFSRPNRVKLKLIRAHRPDRSADMFNKNQGWLTPNFPDLCYYGSLWPPKCHFLAIFMAL